MAGPHRLGPQNFGAWSDEEALVADNNIVYNSAVLYGSYGSTVSGTYAHWVAAQGTLDNIDGSIATATFGTEWEEESGDPVELFERVRLSTMQDIINTVKKSELDRVIMETIKERIDKERKFKEAQRKIAELEQKND